MALSASDEDELDLLAIPTSDIDLAKLTIPQLRDMLSHYHVKYSTSLRKAALVDKVKELVEVLRKEREEDRARTAAKKDRGKVASRMSLQVPAVTSSTATRKPRQTAPAASREKSEVFSDDNPFQSRSARRSDALEADASTSTAKKATSTRRKSSALTASVSKYEATAAAYSPEPSTMRPSRTSPTSPPFKNYMDPAIARTTTPRVLDKVGNAARRIVERFSPAPKSEEGDSDESQSPSRSRSYGRSQSRSQSRSYGDRSLDEEDEDDGEDDFDEDDEDVQQESSDDRIKKESDEEASFRRDISSSPRKRALTKAQRSQASVSPTAAAKQVLSPAQSSSQLLWLSLISIVLACATWYVRESHTIGFCDTGSTSNGLLRTRQVDLDRAYERVAKEALSSDADLFSSLPPLHLPSDIRPTCTPCPPHALCSSGSLQRCASADYILSPALTARIPLLRSLLPLPATRPSCVPDGTKLILAAELGDEIQRVLSVWRGAVLCRNAAPHPDARGANAGRKIGTDAVLEREARRYALPEAGLRADLAGQRDSSIVDDAYFDQLWQLATDELQRRGALLRVHIAPALEEVHEEITSNTVQNADLLLSTDARLPLSCRARLSFASFLRRTRAYVFAVVAIAAALLYGRARWRKARSDRVRVRELVLQVYERLQEQEQSHTLDSQHTPEPYVPTTHLRDHVLRTEPSAVARKRLWAQVAHQVEENANVRTRQAQRRGEWLRVWEWVGVSGGTGGGGGEGKRETKQLLQGSGKEGEAPREEVREMVEKRR